MPVTYIERRRISRNKFIGFTPNRRSERCPQADSAAVKILPYTPQRGISDPSVRVVSICMDDRA